MILGVIWKVLKYGLLSKINLEHHPELQALLADDEEISVLSFLNAEANLLRWFNYQLKKGNSIRKVKNFSEDIKVINNH